jgi:hypothetical protein
MNKGRICKVYTQKCTSIILHRCHYFSSKNSLVEFNHQAILIKHTNKGKRAA